MRSGTFALLGVLAVGLVALLVVGLVKGSSTVYTLGVAPQGPVAELDPGGRVCQGAVDLPDGASYDGIGIYPDGASSLDVVVQPATGGAAIARGTLDGPFGVEKPPRLRTVDVGHRRGTRPVTVCVENTGESKLALWGTGSVASRTTATRDGKPADFDIGVTFESAGERSLIALLPDVAARASVFHPQWVSPLAYALLAALVLIGGPALLVLALRRAV